MKLSLNPNTSTYKIFGLIRDSFGVPKISRLSECAPEILTMLTTKEIEEIKNGTNPYSSN